jgi:hypothetical protein
MQTINSINHGIVRRPLQAAADQPIGDNRTLKSRAPDVIDALGPATTIGELRDRFGMSLSAVAKLSEAERGVLLGASAGRPVNQAFIGLSAGAVTETKAKKKVPAFGSGQKLRTVKMNGTDVVEMKLGPEVDAATKRLSSPARPFVAADFRLPPAKLKGMPTDSAVHTAGESPQSKKKSASSDTAWEALVHDILMAIDTAGPKLSPTFDPNAELISCQKIGAKAALTDLESELGPKPHVAARGAGAGAGGGAAAAGGTSQKTSHKKKSTKPATSADLQLLVHSMIRPGFHAFKVAFAGEGQKREGILAADAKTGEVRALIALPSAAAVG